VAVDELLPEQSNHVGVELVVEGNAILEALAGDGHACKIRFQLRKTEN